MAEVSEPVVLGPRVESTTPVVSLGEYFFSLIENRDGDTVAQVQQVDGEDVTLTYADILRGGKIVAILLREHGIDVGDMVMLFCGNTLDFLPLMLGTMFVGAALAPINDELDAGDVLSLVASIQPKLIITNQAAEGTVLEALSQHSSSLPVVTIATVVQRPKERPDVTDFFMGKVEDPVNDVALVICSSGTTGTPKGVELTHHYVLQLTCSVRDMSSILQVILNISGPYWMSCLILILLSFQWGTKMVILNNFTEDVFLETIQRYKVNLVALGPYHMVDLAKYGAVEKYDISSLRAVVYGGSSMSRKAIKKVEENLGTPVTLTQGMTECYGMFKTAFTVYDKPSNVGTVSDNVIVKIMDIETGKAVGPDQEGEIWVKSPLTFKGYRGNPEATKAMIHEDGFLHTGDIGYYDNDGYFYIVDRLKELFKYRGIHVNPLDIEQVLLQHPQVVNAAVVGIHNDEDQARATAYVVKRAGVDLTEEELEKLVA